ncbi:hypothetical protein [uncultured Aquincola sp.]|uniref:hypothetical protein n=1 Tax=uncultured Aquincola sp. TaxID=886556 RepID=UPI0032B1910F
MRAGWGWLLVFGLSGCALTNERDASFEDVRKPPGVLLLLVGGNSEGAGDKGLWPMRETVAEDLARALAMERAAISTDYMTWTGEPAESDGLLPGRADWWHGHLPIAQRLSHHASTGAISTLVVVGWSNGGATAAQLSAYLAATPQVPRVDLLVTLDPVSTFTARPSETGAGTWLNVYTRSEGLEKLNFGNAIALLGGAWNEFHEPDHGPGPVPALQWCMRGNHGESLRMWRAGVVPSAPFQDWASRTRQSLHSQATPARPQPTLTLSAQACP